MLFVCFTNWTDFSWLWISTHFTILIKCIWIFCLKQIGFFLHFEYFNWFAQFKFINPFDLMVFDGNILTMRSLRLNWLRCIIHINIFLKLYNLYLWFVGFKFFFDLDFVFLLYFFFLVIYKLTATVEPFLPTPPARITLKMRVSDQTPHTTVAIDIVFHSSIPPKIYI